MRKEFSLSFLIGLAWFAGAGCGSTKTLQQSSGITDGDLENAFAFSEVLEKGGLVAIASNRSMIPVDINSAIKVRIDPLKLSALGGEALLAAMPLLQEVTQQRSVLLEVLQAIDKYLDLSKQIQELFAETHDDAGRRLTGKDAQLGKLEQLQTQRGFLILRVLRTFKKYYALSRKLPVPPQVLENVDMMAASQLPIDTDKEISKALRQANLDIASIADPALGAFLKDEINRLDREIKQRRDEILQRSQKIKLRLRATLSRDQALPVQIHLSGYDTLQNGVSQPVDKLSFKLGDEQKAELRKEIDFYGNLAQSVNRIRQKSGEGKRQFISTLDTVKNDLRELRLQLQQSLIPLADSLMQLPQIKGELKSILQRLRDKAAQLNDLAKGFNAAEASATVTPSNILIDRVQAAFAALSEIVEHLLPLLDPDKSESIPAVLEQVIESAKSLADESLKAKIAALKSFWEKNQARFSDFFTLKDLLAARATLSMADGVVIQDAALRIPLNEVTNTEITLLRVPRRHGDRIDFKSELFDENGRLIQEYNQLFVVRSFGFHSNPSGNMIFVKRLRDGATKNDTSVAAQRDIDFVAAPAISYLVEYRSRGDNWCKRAWNLMNPGLGLNTSLLNFDSNDFEFGLGLAASIFGGFLQAGYGYNLQAEKKYFFLGFDLFGMANAIQGRQGN